MIWLFMTQRNGQGPRRFLGLILLQWVLLILMAAGVSMGTFFWLV